MLGLNDVNQIAFKEFCRLAYPVTCSIPGSDSARNSEQSEEQQENLDSINTTEQTQNNSTNTDAQNIEVFLTDEQACEQNSEGQPKVPLEQPEGLLEETPQTKEEEKSTRSLRHSTTSSEVNEEVDDIELIFSSDDKEHLQEDLVSISDFEPWEKTGAAGTPVLVNFNALSSSEELNKKSKNKDSFEMNMETDQDGQENRTDMKRDESVDTFEQVFKQSFNLLVS